MVYGTRFGISVSRRMLASVIVLILSVSLFIGIAGPEKAEAQYLGNQVAAGANHTLRIDESGYLQSWGYNLYGQLGNGTSGPTSTSTPQYIVASDIMSVYSGPAANHSLAIDFCGQLYAWGWNAYGQLGLGDKENKTELTVIGEITCVESLDVSTTTSSTPITPLDFGGDYWQSATAGYRHSAGIKGDGTLWTWGYNDYGQLGDGTKTQRLTPVQVGDANNWVKVVAGFRHTVALNTDGEVWAWGDNTYGQLGDGTNTLRTVPVQVFAPLLTSVQEPSLSKKQKLLSKLKGAAGKVDRSQDGPESLELEPTLVWTDIAVGYHHTLAIAEDPYWGIPGNVYAWGWNANGQLGDGTTANKNQPVQVTYVYYGGFGANDVSSNSSSQNDEPFRSLSAGYYHSLAGNSDYCLYVWGNNSVGQLGNGTRTSSLYPIKMNENMDWVSHASGAKHNIAINAFDYSVWTWGYNATNQLGNGNKYTKYSPVKVIDSCWTYGTNVGINIFC